MFIFLVTMVILLTIFGFCYSRSSSLHVLRAIDDEGESTTIRLPEFMHTTPLIHHPQPGSEGDSGFVQGQGNDNAHQLERRIIDQKIRDANQLGLFVESLWPQTLPEGSGNSGEAKTALHKTDPAKITNQNISHAIYDMIHHETLNAAMAAAKQHQTLAEAAAVPETNMQTVHTLENELNVSKDKEKSLSTDEKNVKQ